MQFIRQSNRISVHLSKRNRHWGITILILIFLVFGVILPIWNQNNWDQACNESSEIGNLRKSGGANTGSHMRVCTFNNGRYDWKANK